LNTLISMFLILILIASDLSIIHLVLIKRKTGMIKRLLDECSIDELRSRTTIIIWPEISFPKSLALLIFWSVLSIPVIYYYSELDLYILINLLWIIPLLIALLILLGRINGTRGFLLLANHNGIEIREFSSTDNFETQKFTWDLISFIGIAYGGAADGSNIPSGLIIREKNRELIVNKNWQNFSFFCEFVLNRIKDNIIDEKTREYLTMKAKLAGYDNPRIP
jgi:hypothetical protein